MKFDQEQLKATMTAHINCGSKGGHMIYEIKYCGKPIGTFKEGRNGKSYFRTAFIGDSQIDCSKKENQTLLEQAILSEYAKVTA